MDTYFLKTSENHYSFCYSFLKCELQLYCAFPRRMELFQETDVRMLYRLKESIILIL